MSQSPVPQLTPDSRPQRADSVIEAVIDGEAVLYDEAGQNLHHLDPVATAVWQLIDGTATVTQMTSELAETFGADPLTVQTDVLAMLGNLLEQGVVTVS